MLIIRPRASRTRETLRKGCASLESAASRLLVVPGKYREATLSDVIEGCGSFCRADAECWWDSVGEIESEVRRGYSEIY